MISPFDAIAIIIGVCVFWYLGYRLQKWELKDETPEERKKRYRITIGL